VGSCSPIRCPASAVRPARCTAGPAHTVPLRVRWHHLLLSATALIAGGSFQVQLRSRARTGSPRSLPGSLSQQLGPPPHPNNREFGRYSCLHPDCEAPCRRMNEIPGWKAGQLPPFLWQPVTVADGDAWSRAGRHNCTHTQKCWLEWSCRKLTPNVLHISCCVMSAFHCSHALRSNQSRKRIRSFRRKELKITPETQFFHSELLGFWTLSIVRNSKN
jgi:hypothetical protein